FSLNTLKASSPTLSQTSSLCPVSSSLPAKTSPLHNTTMVSGSAPLTDSQSLLHSVSKRFDIEEMGSQLCDNRFHIEACCVTMLPSRNKGGRVGMGRHTAIRYLKSSVENPSWWFSVSFDRERENKRCFFDWFNKEENPKFKSEQLVWMSGLFYKPVKMYVVSYLDEY
ncbi:nuclear intron maturase 3, partial [Quercus suber]